MLENINIDVLRWDWKNQTLGKGKDEIGIPVIISRIESGYYKTKLVNLDLQCYNLNTTNFDCPDLFEFLVHYKLVENANLDYPVIINKEGKVIDGRHRICKAILRGDKIIKGIMIMDATIV